MCLFGVPAKGVVYVPDLLINQRVHYNERVHFYEPKVHAISRAWPHLFAVRRA